MKLHTVGDCHANFPWRQIKLSDTKFEEISINQVRGYTINGFAFGKLNVLDISTSWPVFVPYRYDQYFNIKDGDAVVFCIGEIDCRMHLPSPQFSNTWKTIIDDTVPLYFEALKANEEKFNNLHMMVQNVIPPKREKNLVLWAYQHTPCSDELKKNINTYMNIKLKEYCEKYGYIFFDIYDKYCDKDGFLNEKYGDTHIGDPIYYTEFLNNLHF
jgi:hypothetical protein